MYKLLKILFLSLIIISFLSCDNSRIETTHFDSGELKEEIYFTKKDTISKTDYYKNRNIKCIWKYFDNQIESTLYYFEDGKLWNKKDYKNNTGYGIMSIYRGVLKIKHL